MSGTESPLAGLSQRALPSNIQAEQALLGAILASNRAYHLISNFLPAEAFADPIHQRLYQIIAKRIEAGQLADAVTLKDDLQNSAVLDQVGGTPYLAQLLASMVGIEVAPAYAQAIHDAWIRRRGIEACVSAVECFFGADPDISTADTLTAAGDTLALIAEAQSEAGGPVKRRGPVLIGEASAQQLDRADAIAGGRIARPLPTGIASFDAMIGGGLTAETLIGLAALGESGKTELALQIAEPVGLAARRGWEKNREGSCPGIPFFSFDMSATQIATRTLGRISGVPRRRIRHGDLNLDDGEQLRRAMQTADLLPIEIFDDGPASLGRVVRDLRNFVRRRPCPLAIIDNLSKIVGEEKPGVQLFPLFLMCVNKLKGLARELRIPVLLLVHLPQSVAKREGVQRPRRGDLPYGIHLHFDYAIAMWRPALGLPAAPPEKGFKTSAELHAKAVADYEDKKGRLKNVTELVQLKEREDDGESPGLAKLLFDHQAQQFIETGSGE